mgnify:CR=1 FL=1
MESKLERIIFTFLGATAGVVVGIFILTYPIPMIDNNIDVFIVILTGIIGSLLFIISIYYKKGKIAKDNEKLRGETIALTTHEMRTSLTSTSWAISFILSNYKQYISEEDKKTLEDILKSIRTTVMHTVNLLDISLLDIGKLAISLEWVSLKRVEEMIREVIEKYSIGAKKDGVDLIIDIVLDHKNKVEVDNLRLRIILENLLENALQYTKDIKNKEIKVNVNNSPTMLNITISDNGIGIPIHEQSEIFGEFFRASNARRKLSSGSGIGLHLSEQYVKAHHGTIRFESKENVGTTFYISLPLKSTTDPKEFLEKI